MQRLENQSLWQKLNSLFILSPQHMVNEIKSYFSLEFMNSDDLQESQWYPPQALPQLYHHINRSNLN